MRPGDECEVRPTFFFCTALDTDFLHVFFTLFFFGEKCEVRRARPEIPEACSGCGMRTNARLNPTSSSVLLSMRIAYMHAYMLSIQIACMYGLGTNAR